jgi:hypothetical protein
MKNENDKFDVDINSLNQCNHDVSSTYLKIPVYAIS